MDMKPSVCLTWAMTDSAVHAANVYAIFCPFVLLRMLDGGFNKYRTFKFKRMCC